MGTTYTTAYNTQDPSATGIQERTVHDKIRYLFPGASALFAFVSHGEYKKGNLVKRPGMLGKKKTSAGRRYEFFTYSPIATYATVTAVSGSDITLSSSDGFVLKRSVINDNNLEVGRLSSIVTATNVATFTAVTAAFSPAVGDVIMLAGPAYEEGSTSPYSVQKTEDNNYNCMQILRYSWKMTKSAMKSKNFVENNYMDALARRTMIMGNMLAERSFLFGERAATSTTDVTADATLSDSFGTMRGGWNFSQRSFNANNSMSYSKYTTDLPIAMGDTINPAEKVVQFCGRNIFGDMLNWIRADHQPIKDGDLAKFGVKSFKFMTDGPEIEVVLHNLFDTGRFRNRAFIFCPDVLEYVHRTDRDLRVNPKGDIAPNDADYEMREIIGEVTLADLAGGYNSCNLTNWYAL